MAYDRLITTSSSVARIQYSADSQTLRVTYVNGATWDYAKVPESVWDALQLTESVGSYVAKEVKSKYAATKVVDNGGL